MTKNRVIEWAIIIFGLYAIAAYFIKAVIFLELLNGLFLGWFVACAIIFGPQMTRIIWSQDEYTPGSQFMLGLMNFIIAMAIKCTVSVLYRSSDPGLIWIISTHASDFAEFQAIVGGSLMVMTPGAIDLSVGRRDRRTLLICAVAGIGVAVAAFWFQRVNFLGILAKAHDCAMYLECPR